MSGNGSRNTAPLRKSEIPCPERAGLLKITGGRVFSPDLSHELRYTSLVYEALETQPSRPARSFDLTKTTGLARSTIHDALRTLAAWNLAQQRRGRWTLTAGTDLTLLAEQFGCTDTVRTLIKRHRDERAAYRRALHVVDHHPETVHPTTRTEQWPDPEPPPEIETLLDLLERELGAHLIQASA